MENLPKFAEGGIISKELADKITFNILYPHQYTEEQMKKIEELDKKAILSLENININKLIIKRRKIHDRINKKNLL